MKNNEGIIAVFLFWLFGLLVGIGIGSHNAWFAIFGIFSMLASFIIMPKKPITVNEEKDEANDLEH